MQNPQKVQQAVEFIRGRTAGLGPSPSLGLVLGTGLTGALEPMEIRLSLPCGDAPGFPVATAPSHNGRIVLGRLAGVDLWVLDGRAHLYEGRTPAEVCLGVRTLAGLGATTLILTNAAGCLNPAFGARIMCLTDQINFTGQSPLTGPNHAPWGPRFPDMSRMYDPGLADLARQAAQEIALDLAFGVYAGVPGPQMETPAETRALRILGADAVGMSTVLEALAARHMGLEVLGFSVLTNTNRPEAMEPVVEEHVMAMAQATAGDLGRLLAALLPRLARKRGGATAAFLAAPAE